MGNTHFFEREKCPACKSQDQHPVYKCGFTESPIKEYLDSFYSPQGHIEFGYLDGATYSLIECNGCGLIYQKEIPNDQLMDRLYEKWIDPEMAFKRHLDGDDLLLFSYYAQEIMQLIAYFDRPPSALSFLDFGMGWGKWLRMAKAFGCKSYGLELSERRIEYAKSNGIDILDWNKMPQGTFDFINTEQVFEHIAEPLDTLNHLKRSLKQNGLIKISVPDGGVIKRRLKVMDWNAPKGSRNSLNPVAPLEHINCFNRNSIIKMAEIAGLELAYLPLLTQYQFSTGWYRPKRILKNLLFPIYRNVLRKGTYLFFRNKA